MNGPPSKKLTGWMILLIILLGPLSFGGSARSLSVVPQTYRPYLAVYPSLAGAITAFQVLVGAGIAVWAYTAWLLYRREPGTLARAQVGLVTGGLLKIAGGLSIPLFGGLPPAVANSMVQEALPGIIGSMVMIGIWYLYLARSQRVRDIFAG